METFSKRLSKALLENGITKSGLARMIGMSPSVVNNYCSGKREPSLEVLVSISKALGETTDYLLGLTDN